MNRIYAAALASCLVKASTVHAGAVIIWESKTSDPPSLLEELTQIWDVVLAQLATL